MLKAVKVINWKEKEKGLLALDGQPQWVATTDRFHSNTGIFVADGKGGLITTTANGQGVKVYPVAGMGATAEEALHNGYAV